MVKLKLQTHEEGTTAYKGTKPTLALKIVKAKPPVSSKSLSGKK